MSRDVRPYLLPMGIPEDIPKKGPSNAGWTNPYSSRMHILAAW